MLLRTRSLAFRLVAGAAALVAAGLLLGSYSLSRVFHDYVERGFDARLGIMLESLIAQSDIADNGEITPPRALGDPRFEQPYSGWYWQIATKDGPVLRSRSLWDEVLAANEVTAATALRTFEATGPMRQHLRVLTRSVTYPESPREFYMSVAGDIVEIDEETARFNRTVAWALGALGLMLVAAVFVQVRFGLLPLRRIPKALAEIRTGRADRLVGTFSAEVEPLAHEINELLDHNRAVVERARTHVGNLAHALKTPLAVLTNEAAAKGGPSTEAVRRQSEIMRRHVDHHLARARTAARAGVLGARTPVAPVIDDLKRTLDAIHRDRPVSVTVVGAAGAAFRGERRDLEEMLGNLMDNAYKWAKARVRVDVSVRDERLAIQVEDDGPGLSPEERDAVAQRGVRFDEAVPGSGLGLAIVRDVAELYSGGLALEASALGGLSAVLTLPAAPSD
jgi:signal transduction histidine kinase